MKKGFLYSLGISLFLLSSLAQASTFSCTLRESSNDQDPLVEKKEVETNDSDNFELKFNSSFSDDLKIKGSYSAILNSVDSQVTDTKTKMKVLSTDWYNSGDQNAHASIVLNLGDGHSMILQCVHYIN
jgi:hypothetical protein